MFCVRRHAYVGGIWEADCVKGGELVVFPYFAHVVDVWIWASPIFGASRYVLIGTAASMAIFRAFALSAKRFYVATWSSFRQAEGIPASLPVSASLWSQEDDVEGEFEMKDPNEKFYHG